MSVSYYFILYWGYIYMTEAPQDFTYAPNPTLSQGTWEESYPPIKTKSPWLINKFTGEVFPNTEAFARRSDILEPYLGELPTAEQGEVVGQVNQALAQADSGEMAEL